MPVENKRDYIFVNKDQGKVFENNDTLGFGLANHAWWAGTFQAVHAQVHSDDSITLKMDEEFLTMKTGVLGTELDPSILGTSVPVDPHRHWIVKQHHDEYYHIRNVKTHDLLAFNSSTNKVECRHSTAGDEGLWKLVLLPNLRDLESHFKSAEEWRDIARYIFQEGYKMIKFAGEDKWLDSGDEYRQSYADLFRQMGEKKDVYP